MSDMRDWIILLCLLMVSLLAASCSSSDSTATSSSNSTVQVSAVTAAELVGTWVSPYLQEGGMFIQDRNIFSGTNVFAIDDRNFSDAACTVPATPPPNPTQTGSYVLGTDLSTSNGPATRIDLTLPIEGAEKAIVAKSGNILYFGFNEDGTAPVDANGYPTTLLISELWTLE